MKKRAMNPGEVALALSEVPEWTLAGGVIETWRDFAGFAEALGFVKRVGDIAEAMDHHPDMDVRFNMVRLAVCTHSVGGLTGLDFELARRVDALMSGVNVAGVNPEGTCGGPPAPAISAQPKREG